MKKYLPILRDCPLFRDIEDESLTALLGCLGARVKTYEKNEILFAEGAAAVPMGIVLSGEVQMMRLDFRGNRSIVAMASPGEMFGESFACAEVEALPLDVVATEPAEVMLIDARRTWRTCGNACSFHSQIIFNLMKILAAKNLDFHRKLEITSRRTTREKLLTYLTLESKARGTDAFEIPYDRQELADYLEVDRTGLSSEIGKLKREGVLDCRRQWFSLNAAAFCE